ncbi:MAG: MBL fold metallo-hydrolase [Spirochaetes bacterium]|nr:MBL fold metallo-hydrolase [Spirochaetota bacterium]
MIIHKIGQIGSMKSNCYIVSCQKTKKGIIIDPGGKGKEILKYTKEQNIKILFIFNTHHHADHTGANRFIKKHLHVPIVIHQAEIPYLRKRMRGDNITTGNFSLSPKPEIIIEEEQVIEVGELKFQLYHTPGHTPGGLCYYCERKLFTGDTLFVGDSGATIYPGGNRPTLGMSIRRIMSELPGNTEIYPGHDLGPTPTSTLDWEKRNNVNAVEYGYYVEE